jgi:hypothetical protein
MLNPLLGKTFVVNSEPHTGARPSARLCLGLIKKISFCFTLVCCVLCEFYESVLALGCCKSWDVAEVEGRAPSLMIAAVEIGVS